jgi:hypothetical protein
VKTNKAWLAALAAVAALVLAVPSINADKPAATPTSNAFGQSFAEWMRDFWAWTYVGVGQPLQQNNVYFLPIPAPATWEDRNGKTIGIGEMNVTVKPGTKIVLGVLSWIGETYQDHNGVLGSHDPDDPAWVKGDFLPPNGEAVIKLDGVPLVDASNLGDFYFGPINFKETLWYGAATSYGSTGAIYVQGIGVVLPPMSAGTHTLTLYSWDAWRGLYGDGGAGWFNTWHITVQPPGKK